MFVNDLIIHHVVFEDSTEDIFDKEKKTKILLDYLNAIVGFHHLINDYVVQGHENYVDILPVAE